MFVFFPLYKHILVNTVTLSNTPDILFTIIYSEECSNLPLQIPSLHYKIGDSELSVISPALTTCYTPYPSATSASHFNKLTS